MFQYRQQQQLLLLLPLLGALLLSLAACSAQAENAPKIQACGQALNSILYGFCKGRFAGFMPNKRAALDLFDYADQQQQQLNGLNGLNGLEEAAPLPYRWPLASGVAGEGSLLATRRLHRGVVDECCTKPCSTSEMRFYCLD